MLKLSVLHTLQISVTQAIAQWMPH